MTVITIFVLFIVGIVCLLLEAILPYGISAVAGLAVIGYSVYLAFHTVGPELGFLYCLMAFATALILIRVAFRSGLEFLALGPPEPRTKQRTDEPSPGEFARVVQPLRPTGTIEWNSRRFAARSIHPERDSPIGADVVVRGRESIYFLVEEGRPAPSDPAAEPMAPGEAGS